MIRYLEYLISYYYHRKQFKTGYLRGVWKFTKPYFNIDYAFNGIGELCERHYFSKGRIEGIAISYKLNQRDFCKILGRKYN